MQIDELIKQEKTNAFNNELIKSFPSIALNSTGLIDLLVQVFLVGMHIKER